MENKEEEQEVTVKEVQKDNDTLEWAKNIYKIKRKPQTQPQSFSDNKVLVAHERLSLDKDGQDILVLADTTSQDDKTVLQSLRQTETEEAKKRVEAGEKLKRKRGFELWEESATEKQDIVLSKYDNESKVVSETSVGLEKVIIESTSEQSTKEDTSLSKANPYESDNSTVKLNKKGMRRKRTLTFNDPTPLPSKRVPQMQLNTLQNDDEDLLSSMAKSRKEVLNKQQFIGYSEEMENQIEGMLLDDYASLDNIKINEAKRETEQESSERIEEAISAVNEDPVLGNNSTGLLPKDMLIEREPLVRVSVSAALNYLSRIGMRPALCHEDNNHNNQRQVTLEHYDEEGNILSPKEAYKYLSHKFHGRNPGKSKKTKQAHRKQLDRLIQQCEVGDTPLGMASALRVRQRETGSSHVVLQQGSHGPVKRNVSSLPKQPSDTAKKVEVRKAPRIFGMK